MAAGPPERSFLILHGWQNRRPPEHWQHWLADRLREEGAHVIYPQLPVPDEPQLEVWLEELDQHLGRLLGIERVVIGHSLGALLWLHYARRVTDPVDRVLLVSPPGPEAPAPEIAPFFAIELNPEAVAGAARSTEIACSDNDPYSDRGAVEAYAKPLRLRYHLIAGAAHINPDSGYGPWPGVLNWARGSGGPL
jgi:serine hydrolase